MRLLSMKAGKLLSTLGQRAAILLSLMIRRQTLAEAIRGKPAGRYGVKGKPMGEATREASV